jgi:hypothetical protein
MNLMSAQPNPISSILIWIDSLPPELRETVALLVLSNVPDFKMPEDFLENGRTTSLLQEWLSMESKTKQHIIGKTIIFRSLVNYRCCNLFSKEYREINRDSTKQFKEDLLAKGNETLAKKIDSSLQREPLRSAQWLKAAQSWEELSRTDISDVALKRYEFKNLPGLPKV